MDHFTKHQAEFGVSTADEYLGLAEEFMYGALGPNARECARPSGDVVRFDLTTHELAVASGGIIKTYHIPSPRRIRRKGGELGYFIWECGRSLN
jgi:filamentous hemagglutinin